MAARLLAAQSAPLARRAWGRSTWQLASAAFLLTSLWAGPSFAKDPFRTKNPREIGDNTEQAFKQIFQQGNYRVADRYLQKAEPTEPLGYALKALRAYSDWQGANSQEQQAKAQQFLSLATQTRESADQLKAKDPLRGNLYIAVGYFLEAAYSVGKEGLVRGTPQALSKVQKAFQYLDKAEAIDGTDPELNLLRGNIDLMLAIGVNLPLSSPTEAMNRLQQYAAPDYVAYRSLAIGYRDLKQLDKALPAVNQALQAAPTNPELLYLKAQILRLQGKVKESIPLFEQALQRQDELQLPRPLAEQINRELKRARETQASAR